MTPVLPGDVRDAITDRIEAMTPLAGYSWGSDDAWSESEVALVPEWQADTQAHLSFFVDDREAEVDTTTRQLVAPDDTMMVVSPMVIRFLFQIRPDQRKTDWDASARAAVHVLREVCRDEYDIDLICIPDRRVMSRIPLGVAEFLAVEVRIIARYPLNLADPV